MRLVTSLVAFYGLLALGFASDPSPSQTTAAAADLVSYLEGLATGAAFNSLIDAFKTDAGGASSLAQFASSVASLAAHGETPSAGYLNALPTNAQSFFGSVVTAEASILNANGFTSAAGVELSAAQATSSKTSSGAAATGAVGVAAGLGAGFMAAVMAL